MVVDRGRVFEVQISSLLEAHHFTCIPIWPYISVHLSVVMDVSHSDECRIKIFQYVKNNGAAFSSCSEDLLFTRILLITCYAVESNLGGGGGKWQNLVLRCSLSKMVAMVQNLPIEQSVSKIPREILCYEDVRPK